MKSQYKRYTIFQPEYLDAVEKLTGQSPLVGAFCPKCEMPRKHERIGWLYFKIADPISKQAYNLYGAIHVACFVAAKFKNEDLI